MTEQIEQQQQQNGTRKSTEKRDEEITTYSDGKNVYHINDTVYIESQRPDMPYYICSIRDFKRSKKDNITVDVIWFYRPCEIPTSVYQLLLQDRSAENGSNDSILDNPVVKSRELFISDAIDVYPASALRGHVNCRAFSDVKENVLSYISEEDNWFYILRYNPESRRMANAKGEIRIGVSHQACLPECIPLSKRKKSDLKELYDTYKEELLWDPSIPKSKLMVYLRAARSITSFNGFCNDQDACPEKNSRVSEDQTIAYSYDTLHKNRYNISEALQELIRAPSPKVTTLPMTDDERKKFMRGLRSYGKTFHKIRKELLPDRTTSELVQYYYIWKKTASAITSRPHKRGGRRNHVQSRKTRTTKPKTAEASEFLDLSSCSENECMDSDESENARNLSLYACRHCYTTESPNWHHAGKPKVLLCYSCRMHFKRYGHMRALKQEDKREPPSFIYKAAFENLDEDVNKRRMRTRRSSTPVFANSTRSRQNAEVKISSRKQVTPQNCRDNSSEKDDAETKTNGSKRKNSRDSDDNQDCKKSRIQRKESDEDADDESEGDSTASSSRPDSNNQASTESSRSHSPLPHQQQQNNGSDIQNVQDANTQNTFVPIKTEELDPPMETYKETSPPSSPDVPDDVELNKKVIQRFKHNETEAGSSCSRCERIYVHKRPKKQRNPDVEAKRRDEYREREINRRREASPPPHQPAQITSHYETMRCLIQAQRDSHRFWNNNFHVPPEVHGHRSISPRDPREFMEHSNKFEHMFKTMDRPTDHRSPHAIHPLPQPHPAHPFTQRPADTPRDYRIPPNGRGYISNHVPTIEGIPRVSSVPTSLDGLSRAPSVPAGLDGLSRVPSIPANMEGMGVDRVPAIERPTIDPVTGLPHYQPQLHSHLHTHTHLHVHPDEIKYRGGQPPSESALFERHERAPPHPVRQPSPAAAPHRPRSRSREYNELKQYSDIVMHHDPHFRESLSRHHIPSSRESHLPIREEAISPSMPHEPSSVPTDPVAYYFWLKQRHPSQHVRMNTHAQVHAQAPELSPHGMPQPSRHPHELRSEHEKHINEKLLLVHSEREKQAHLEHLRLIEHEKHIRHLHQAREISSRELPPRELPPRELPPRDHIESLKMKGGEHVSTVDRPSMSFRPPDIHSPYASHFMDTMRRVHEPRPIHNRNLHDPVRYSHERAERERIAHMERIAHAERFPDRGRHERPSIFGHFKPETIDLSDD